MINLIIFGLMTSTLCGVVFWLAHDRNKYYRERREALKTVEPKAGRSVPPLFDTLRYFKRLCDAGIPEAHAVAMTEALVVALNEAFQQPPQTAKSP